MAGRFFIICLVLLANIPLLQAQVNLELDLAMEYYHREEYDKASAVFEKLFEDKATTVEVYKYYLNTLIILQDFKKGEKVVKKMIKGFPDNLSYSIDLGYLYAHSDRETKSKEKYQDVIKRLVADKVRIRMVANAFLTIDEHEFALATYKKGNRLYNNFPYFNYDMAGVYEAMGDKVNMITAYLDYLAFDPNQKQMIKTALQRTLSGTTDFRELQAQLYRRIQKNPDNPVFPEFLIWHFIQRKDFASAFIQVKALDKRLKENGQRVVNLARTANTEGDYDAAISCYDYVVGKGKKTPYYMVAKRGILESRKAKITLTSNYTDEDIQGLKTNYLQYLEEFGKNVRTVPTIRDLAELEAKYIHDIDAARKLMEEAIKMPGLNRNLQGKCKIDLGDIYLISGDVWESTLLYSQVDKAMKDEPLGEYARFKNAKLSYYKGEFEWSQAQLNVLKASTSELIANDALNLSVFIMDHLGLDSTQIPMRLFARADLLRFQNKSDESILVMDSILQFYPGHSLTDDIYYAKANIMVKQGKYDKARQFLDHIVQKKPDDLLADDAIFLLAEINQVHLDNPEAAKQLYEKIILDYKDSLYAVEARKRYRKLRGDNLN